MEYGVLVVVDRCIGCRACQVACHVWNGTEAESTEFSPDYTNPPDLTSNVWTVVRFVEMGEGDGLRWYFVKRQCMHCVEPACVAACPTGALHKDKDGIVLWDSKKCIGCRYCVEACPYGVPHFDPLDKTIRKCTFCADRVREGLEPACVAACPTDALIFGSLDEIRARAEEYRAKGHPVYGLEEGGGTSWIYVFPKETAPSDAGLPRLGPETPRERIDKGLLALAMAAVAGLAAWGVSRGKAAPAAQEVKVR